LCRGTQGGAAGARSGPTGRRQSRLVMVNNLAPVVKQKGCPLRAGSGAVGTDYPQGYSVGNRLHFLRLDHRGLEPGPLAVARLADDERLLLGLVTDLVVLPSSATSLSSTTMILRSPALSNQTKNATAPNTSSLPKTSSSTPSGSA